MAGRIDRRMDAKRKTCSVADNLIIQRAGRAEYQRLARFHYRDTSLGPYAAIFAMCDKRAWGMEKGGVVGAIVYSMPVPNLALRNVVTDGRYAGFGDRRLGLAMLNREVRLISRVVIEPRYRGLGLAARLVRETMPKMNVPFVEAQAVMGKVNPFLERAGMSSIRGAVPVRAARLIELLSAAGIEEEEFVDPAAVHAKLGTLEPDLRSIVEYEFRRFLQAYGRRKNMPDGVERTAYIISKLGERPVYYYWFDPGWKRGDKQSRNADLTGGKYGTE
ncbi:hypothetical protein STSP2_00103 [Anaerohalosphaera lusitana]|uniref:N-acetyltransferase domain-containing protein n=1 Tax=Anaerohalosphaera lusitana TaxID=1936003 RepID=A0A1U9NGM9_9BACT|nr:hypothetical protein [Anaerohalosphaera lusitana]AQT66965.1 hypothetical protein STSP2_00103 [Anaerohalosphaera lusitana]